MNNILAIDELVLEITHLQSIVFVCQGCLRRKSHYRLSGLLNFIIQFARTKPCQ